MIIKGCKLIQTCGACPEQYDVFLGEDQIGYLRLRHGYFTADYLYCGGETIFSGNPKGDGIFESDEREYWLEQAVMSLLIRHLCSNERGEEEGILRGLE